MAASETASRRPGPSLYRYVARETLVPSALAIGGLTTVVLTRELIGLTELVVNRGVGGLAVLAIVFHQAVLLASALLPFAGLIGCMVALGRLGADREILALEAAGVSAARLTGPFGAIGALLASATALLTLVGAPAAQRALERSFETIARNQPWTQIHAGEVNRFGGWQLEAREVGARGDVLRGVLLWVPDLGETIIARRGHVDAAADGSLMLELEKGSLILSPERGAAQMRFERMTTKLPASDQPLLRDPAQRLRGLGLAALDRVALESDDPATAVAARREWHQRFAMPVTALVLGFLAAPLFLTRAHFSRAGGGMLGIGVTVATFATAQLGEGLAQAGVLGVAAGVWLPNALLGAAALVLSTLARRHGVLRRSLGQAVRRERRAPPALPGRRPEKTHRRALPRYVARRFVELALLSFGLLLAAYLLVDVMERLDWFARYRASGDEVLRFYAARVPLLASRVVPMALLVASALIASLLAVEGELIGMRACGIPAFRGLAPALAISVLVTPFFFLMRNELVPRTNALADELKQTEIKDAYLEQLAASRTGVEWYPLGTRLIEAARVDTSRGDARDLTIYELGEDGLPTSRADAATAQHIGGGVWRLHESTRLERAGEGVARVPARSYVELGEQLSAELDTMHLSVGQLAGEIASVEAEGYDATPLRVDFHTKLADALTCIVLPASVLLFAVTGPPFPAPAQTLLVSALLIVAQVLLTGLCTSLGYRGTLPPLVAGWAPTAVFAALVAVLSQRVWKRL